MNNTNTTATQQALSLLNAAVKYNQLRWSVIPSNGNKKPALRKWKPYQNAPADERTLKDWFSDLDSQERGIAVVCGRVSGNLVVRDFDAPGSYDLWALAHSDLARKCPTVMTGRQGGHGRHGYVLSDKPAKTKQLEDGGHVKAEGSYVIAPPSTGYHWLVDPWQVPPPTIDLHAAGFLCSWNPKGANVTQHAHAIGFMGPPPGSESISSSPPGSLREIVTRGNKQKIADAIARTIPSGPGQRNAAIFRLCRELKSIPSLRDRQASDLEPIIREWHTFALPFISTKEYEETLCDFAISWPRVKSPMGEGSLSTAIERARAAPTPLDGKRFENPHLRLLVSLCHELQRERGDRPFFLACRDAAEAIGLTGDKAHVKAWRWLKMLCELGLLSRGTPGDRDRANEYRWEGGTIVAVLDNRARNQKGNG